MFWHSLFTRNEKRKEGAAWYVGAVVSADNTLLCVGTHMPSLQLTYECTLDTKCVQGILVTDTVRAIMRGGPSVYPHWRWDQKSLSFVPSNIEHATEYAREQALVSHAKMNAFFQAAVRINQLRNKLDTGFLLQSSIYRDKTVQAERVCSALAAGETPPSAPYIEQYASLSKIDLEQAANEVLLQANLDDEILLWTERARLLILKRLRMAKTVAEVETAMRMFHKKNTL